MNEWTNNDYDKTCLPIIHNFQWYITFRQLDTLSYPFLHTHKIIWPILSCYCTAVAVLFLAYLLPFSMLQVTSSLVVTSDKINACSVYTQQVYLHAVHVSVGPCPHNQWNAKNADVTSLPNWYWLGAYLHCCSLLLGNSAAAFSTNPC